MGLAKGRRRAEHGYTVNARPADLNTLSPHLSSTTGSRQRFQSSRRRRPAPTNEATHPQNKLRLEEMRHNLCSCAPRNAMAG